MDQPDEPERNPRPLGFLSEWLGVPPMIKTEWTALSYFFAFLAGALVTATLIALIVFMVREIAYHL